MSLRQLFSSAIELVQLRVELLGNEIELEKRRFFDGILLAACAMVFLSVGLLMTCATVVFLYMENYKLQACLVLSLLFLVLGMMFVLQARSRLKNPLNIFRTPLASYNRPWSAPRR
jgi:uncharacterized membrane protein YqjE